MSIISMILVVIVAFLAGMEGILDEFAGGMYVNRFGDGSSYRRYHSWRLASNDRFRLGEYRCCRCP